LLTGAGLLSGSFAPAAQADTGVEINTPSGSVLILTTPDQAAPKAEQEAPHGPALYVSGETRLALGDALSDRILAWANESNPKMPTDVVVVMPHDSLWKVLPQDFKDKIESHRGLKAAIGSRLATIGGMPVTFPLPQRVSENKAYCVIQLPEMVSDPSYYARIFAMDKSGRMSGSFGTAQQSMALIAAHETTHCGHKMHAGLAEELDADDKAMEKVIRDWAKLPFTSEAGARNVLRGFMGARGAGLFAGNDHDHATFAGLGIPGMSYSQSQSRPLQERDVGKIKASIIAMEQKVLTRRDQNLKYRVPAELRLTHAMESLSDPVVLYKVIKQLYHERAFDDDPLQRYMAEGYLEWTAKYFKDVIEDSAELPAPVVRDAPFEVATPGNAPN
jgi:hypothetical protein